MLNYISIWAPVLNYFTMKTAKTSQYAAVSSSMSSRTPTSHRTFIEKNKIITQKVAAEKVSRTHETISFELGSAKQRAKTSSRLIGSSRRDEVKTAVTNKENIIGRKTRTTSVVHSHYRIGSKVKGYTSSSIAGTPSSSQSSRKMETMEESDDSVVAVAELKKNKRALEQQVSELVRNAESKKAEIAQLKMELNKYKEKAASSSEENVQGQIEHLQRENLSLKERLAHVGGSLEQSALSDSEKELLLQTTKCSSAPPSIIGIGQEAVPARLPLISSKSDGGGSVLDLGAEGVDALYVAPVPDWDKQSSSSLSEMSVACLQDRILQMEETHYSTNEELQATLQELTDLQDQLTELQVENERLAEEKAVLLESLCSQTEKLEDCRAQNEMLRQLLVQQDGSETALTASEREMKLLELIKTLEEEKESVVNQLSELHLVVEASQEEGAGKQDELVSLSDKVNLLQSTIESLMTDKKLLEKQSAESRELAATSHLEMTRMKTQLDNERIKVMELQQAREIADKSELDEMLDNARREKERAECDVVTLTDKLAVGQCETAKLKDTLAVLQDEMLVVKNNAKKQIADLEFTIEQLKNDKEQIMREMQLLKNNIHEVEHKCQRHLMDKRELRSTISELRNRVQECELRVEERERQLREAEDRHMEEIQEWKQFQGDLLISVRVANDFKTEAQQDLERLVLENKQLKDKVHVIVNELEKMKVKNAESSSPPIPIQGRVMRTMSSENQVLTTVEQEIVRQNRNRSDSRPLSVKSLIESIECATKQVKAQNGNAAPNSTNNINIGMENTPAMRNMETSIMKDALRPVMTDSSSNQEHGNSLTNLVKNSSLSDLSSAGKNSVMGERTTLSPSGKVVSSENESSSKTVPSPISILANKLDPMRRNSYSNDTLDKKDPLCSLVKGGGSKRNALLKWCQNKTVGYKGIDITNFSSSWNDGLAFCALLHTYLPDRINYDELDNKDKRRNFTLAFKAAESIGISCSLNINDMISMERPDWQAVMSYVTALYKHFET